MRLWARRRHVAGLGAVVALATALVVGLASAATIPGRAAVRRSITPLALCDYGALSIAHPAFVATHFAWVVTGDNRTPALLHAINPSIRVLDYFNALFTAHGDTGFPESAYLHDPALNTRLVGQGSPSLYVMDASSPAWRAIAVARAVAAVEAGYDGMHIDDVWGDLADPQRAPLEPAIGPHYKAVPAWYSVTRYQTGVAALLAEVNAAIRPRVVVYNGINPLVTDTGVRFDAVASGAVQEGWVYDNRYGQNYAADALWTKFLTDVLAAPPSKRIGIISYGDLSDVPARLYGLASYLLISRPNTTFSYGPSCSVLAYPAEWGARIGVPIHTVRSLRDLPLRAGQVYERRFTNGLVLVNPASTGAPAVRVGRGYSMLVPRGGNVSALGGNGILRRRPVSSVTLAPHSGAILVRTCCRQ